MSLSINTTTVAGVLSTSSTVNTSASFTAPANSRLIVLVTTNKPSAGNSLTASCSGGGLTWTRRASLAGSVPTNNGTSAEIYEAWNASSQSMTVSVTPNASASGSTWELRTQVCICTGDEGATFTGATNTSTSPSGFSSASVTAVANSLLLAAVGDWSHSNPPGPAVSFTGDPNTTVITSVEDGQYLTGFFISNSPTSAGTSTLSTTAPTAQNYNMAMIEIKAGATGGVTMAAFPWIAA